MTRDPEELYLDLYDVVAVNADIAQATSDTRHILPIEVIEAILTTIVTGAAATLVSDYAAELLKRVARRDREHDTEKKVIPSGPNDETVPALRPQEVIELLVAMLKESAEVDKAIAGSAVETLMARGLDRQTAESVARDLMAAVNRHRSADA